MNRTYLIILFLAISTFLSAQVDKEFWFVASDITHAHGDSPIIFRVTALDKDATVNLKMFANGKSKTIHVAANTQEYIEIKNKNAVENKPANSINNKGVHITSDENITVYYEVANRVNPDKYTLKGNNALGTEFYLPGQNLYSNYPLSVIGDEKADIVATEDNTEITIVPTIDIIGHDAGESFTIVLNKGQTYCLESRDTYPETTIAGTHIRSNKPIAITVSDDSIRESYNAHSYDLIGDQIVPVDVLGSEYVAGRTSNTPQSIEKIFVTAIKDDTHIYIGNNANTMCILDKGETKDFDIDYDGIYIKSNHVFYAYQVTGIKNKTGNEMGSALLPNANCTGSKSVAFTRTMDKRLFAQICTQKRNRHAFSLVSYNGADKNYLLNNIKWQEIPGTKSANKPDATWYTACVQLGWTPDPDDPDKELGIQSGETYTIVNSKGLFHFSILDENFGSMSYGYFSSYRNAAIKGLDQACYGNTITLGVTYPVDKYQWFAGKSGNKIIGTGSTINVNQTDKYWVKTENYDEGCTQTDTIHVNFIEPKIDLGPDITLCPYETVHIVAKDGYQKYEWENGSNGRIRNAILQPNDNFDWLLKITDSQGCSNTDTINIKASPLIDLQIDSKKDYCKGEKIMCPIKMDHYKWIINGITQFGHDKNWIEVNESGKYELIAWNEGDCENSVVRNVVMHDLPNIHLNDVIECPLENASEIFDGGNFISYLWHDGSTDRYFKATEPGQISVKVVDKYGCKNDATANYRWYPKNKLDASHEMVDVSLCQNTDHILKVDQGYNNYRWYKDGHLLNNYNNAIQLPITNGQANDQGHYKVTAIDNNNCPIECDMQLTIKPTIEITLGKDRNICEGEKIKIETGHNDFISYEWLHKDLVTNKITPIASGKNYIYAEKPGEYTLNAVLNNQCGADAHVLVSVNAKPELSITDNFSICPKNTLMHTLKVEECKYSNNHSVNIKKYKWSTNQSSSSIKINKPDTYELIIEDANGCLDTGKVVVSEFPQTILELGKDPEICDKQIHVFDIPSELVGKYNSYQWVKDKTQYPLNTAVNATDAGKYILNVKDINNCPLADTINLIVNPLPKVALLGDHEACQGQEIKIVPNKAFKKYAWNDDQSDNKPEKIIKTSGEQKLTVWNEKNCSSSVKQNYTFHKVQKPNLGNDKAVCAGNKVLLSVPSSYNNIKWNTGATTNQIEVEKGTYILQALDINNCPVTDTIKVSWYPIPEVDLGKDTIICPINEVTLSIKDIYASQLWHNGETDLSIIADVDKLNRIDVIDNNGCHGWDTKMVTELPLPEIEIIDDQQACSVDTIVLDAGEGFNSYKWLPTNTIDQFLKVVTSGEYIVEVNDGCFILRDTATIEYYPTPVIAQLDTSVVGIVRVLADGGTKPYKYRLNDDDWQSEGIFNISKNGKYILTCEDQNGCYVDSEFALKYHIEIDIPKFLTPNEDGINDRFEIKGLEKYPGSIIRIYDRYGKKITEYKVGQPAWDGKYLGKAVRSDDYWYVIEVMPFKTKYKGNVTLKR